MYAEHGQALLLVKTELAIADISKAPDLATDYDIKRSISTLLFDLMSCLYAKCDHKEHDMQDILDEYLTVFSSAYDIAITCDELLHSVRFRKYHNAIKHCLNIALQLK
jgi:hypothetical protein